MGATPCSLAPEESRKINGINKPSCMHSLHLYRLAHKYLFMQTPQLVMDCDSLRNKFRTAQIFNFIAAESFWDMTFGLAATQMSMHGLVLDARILHLLWLKAVQRLHCPPAYTSFLRNHRSEWLWRVSSENISFLSWLSLSSRFSLWRHSKY